MSAWRPREKKRCTATTTKQRTCTRLVFADAVMSAVSGAMLTLLVFVIWLGWRGAL